MHGAVVHAIALVAVVGIAAQWVAWRLRLPAIVLLTATGLLLGPGLGLLHPSEQFGELLEPFVGFAVAIILFEGGLRLKLHDLDEAGRGVGRLCTVGLLLSWGLGTAAARLVGGLEMPVATLLGAILVVTGPTVIIPLLRQVRLQPRLSSLFKWEGIVNDPLGALATVLAFEVAVGGTAGGVAGRLGLALAGGGALGAAGGLLLGWTFRHGHVPQFQKAPALVAAVFGVFALGNTIQAEAGLLAVTVMGFVVGNFGLPSIGELTRFKDSISTVLVSGVFLVVSADMKPETLASLDARAAAFLACVLFVVRPLSVLLATTGAGMPRNERLMVAWIAPRGVVAAAVAGVFGPRLVEAGHADGALLVPLVFATILLTVVLHGFSLGALARALGLSSKRGEGVLVVGATRWGSALAEALHALDVPVIVADTSWDRLRRPRLAGVPVHYGEVLSEAGEIALPLHQVDVVLAVTSNDAYNALVCVHFGPELGRDRVYQLAADETDPEHRQSVLSSARGRVLVADALDYDVTHKRVWEGWTFKATRLTDTYDRAAWERDAAAGAAPVLCVRENGRLAVNGPRFPLEAGPGDTLLAFVPPEQDAKTKDAPRAAADHAEREKLEGT